MYINRFIQWQDHEVYLNGHLCYSLTTDRKRQLPLACYEQAGITYPKFFKMDLLSKLAFVAAELLSPFPDTPVEQTAVVLSTASGCIDVDKKYDESRKDIASPALFVYTLPNIMLGELCIRHGFKGEQLCTVCQKPDPSWLTFWVNDLISQAQRNTAACLCGHVDATEKGVYACLMYVSSHKESKQALPFDQASVAQLFNPTF